MNHTTAEIPACDVNYNVLLDYGYLLNMAHKCANGVRWKPSVQRFEINKLRWVSSIYNDLKERNFQTRGFYEFYIKERGKTRFIQSVHISERTVQKALTNGALKPIILPKLVYDNSASVKGKGTEFAIKRLKQHLARHYRKYGREGGILVMDYKNYFASISHKKLKEQLRKYIKDDELYEFTLKFIDCYENDKGIGLGSEVSQIFAICFPNIIDHYFQNQKEIESFARFMDDSYCISYNLDELRRLRKIIIDLANDLELEINKKRLQIIKFNGGSFTYLKKRFYLNENGKVIVRLSREAIVRQRRKMKKQKKLLDNNKFDIEHIRLSYIAWRGMAKKYNSYLTINNMDKLYVRLFKEKF